VEIASFGFQALIQIPSLQALKQLVVILFPEDFLIISPVPPFAGSQFPSLQSLRLQRHCETYGIFGTCSQPSVQTLHLSYPRTPLADPSWRTTFPNLTSLRTDFEPDKAEDFLSTLSYILTHLTNLVHLDLDLSGGEPKYVPTFSHFCSHLLTGRDQEVGITDELVNGIYQIPSLRNMRGTVKSHLCEIPGNVIPTEFTGNWRVYDFLLLDLKTLRYFPRLRSNLDAIFHMTRIGSLVPLDKLVLSRLPCDMELMLMVRNECSSDFNDICK